MKIANSAIAMASSHRESSFSFKESASIEVAKSKDAAGAILTLSKEASGKSLKEAMVDYQEQEKEQAKKNQADNEERSMQRMLNEMKANKKGNNFEISDEYDWKIKLLRRILAALRGEKLPNDDEVKSDCNNDVLDLRSASYKKMDAVSVDISSSSSVSLGTVEVGTTNSGTTWQKITATSGFNCEFETTTFASSGIVNTADGRNIDFNIEVSMSRAFMSQFDNLEVQEYIKTDPLMINLDTNIGSVSDQKFLFDLDSDGEEENISFAGEGSGFLVLDKNEDGKINDGSELFGTKSGDGFKDLGEYDEDGNHWIDENDSVFYKLKIWTKDKDGRDVLMNLKEADVGAIYLGKQDTQFSLKDDDNNLNGQIQKTGIYLKESSGGVGTLNHVDLVI